jgi:hypothetical protein
MENPHADVFVYTGGGVPAPRDVVRLRVDPSVTSIPAQAFFYRKKLIEVELCEGLIVIGRQAFDECDHSITKINVPTTLRWIDDFAFYNSLRTSIRLPDGIESIGEAAFGSCIFTNFRVPSLITVIPGSMLMGCNSTFSVELPEIVAEIESTAFRYCYCLRNVAFPPDAVSGDVLFINEEDDAEIYTDLQQLFGSNVRIISVLMHRFDGLPIHSIVYYQSYTEGVLQILLATINSRSGQSQTLRSKLDPTGNLQDCLGMTPLHILACSSVHNLEVYRVIVEKYPTNLIIEDRWGALPLLYAFWGAAPAEIVQFLIESYQTFYPGHVLNWTTMVETMGRYDTPKERIEKLLTVKQMHFPEQRLDWEYLLDKFAQRSNLHILDMRTLLFQEQMQFLFMCGMSERVKALPFKVWRDHITNMIQTSNFGEYKRDNSIILRKIRAQLAHFEDELQKLKEVTTILELTLWKMMMNEKSHHKKDGTNCHQKKMKTDESVFAVNAA